MDAGYGPGRITITDDCVFLRSAGVKGSTLAWRSGDSGWDPATREIVYADDTHGVIGLSDGDRVSLGGFGGFTLVEPPNGPFIRWLVEPDASCPPLLDQPVTSGLLFGGESETAWAIPCSERSSNGGCAPMAGGALASGVDASSRMERAGGDVQPRGNRSCGHRQHADMVARSGTGRHRRAGRAADDGLVPRVAVTYFGSPRGETAFETWEAVGRWLATLQDPSSRPTPALVTKARELTTASGSDLDRLRAIAAYAQKVQYISIQTGLGRGGGYKPHAAEDVLAAELRRLQGQGKSDARAAPQRWNIPSSPGGDLQR